MTRFLALGDSYTIGEAVSPDDAWPNMLADRLGIPRPQIIARSSWTSGELQEAIDAANPQPPFDLVTLLIGVNNQYRGRSEDDYRTELAALVDRAMTFSGGDPRRVIVISIPDWGVTPFAEGRDRQQIAREIDRFNEINREESRRAGSRYVDVTTDWRRVPDVAGDGLHPSAAAYRRWTDLILSEARDVLELK